MAKLHINQQDDLFEQKISSEFEAANSSISSQETIDENILNEKEEIHNKKDIFSPKKVLKNCTILIFAAFVGVPISKLLGFEFEIGNIYPYLYQLFFIAVFWINKRNLNNWFAINKKNTLGIIAWGVCWICILVLSFWMLRDLFRFNSES